MIALCAPTDIHALARFCGQDTAGVAPGLGSTATTPLIIGLLQRGHSVTVYTLSENLENAETYRWGELTVHVGPCRTRHLARNYYRQEIDWLRERIERTAPPFVHAHWTYEFALGALRSGVRTVTTIHDLPWNVLRYYRDPHRVMRLLMAYEVAARGVRFTAVSQDAATHFCRYFKTGAEIAVIHNGLSSERFAAEIKPMAQSKGCTFATVLQGWSRRKNASVALYAFDRVRRAAPESRMLMFGYDYQPGGPAHRWAIKQKLNVGVTFVGPVPYEELLTRVSDHVDVLVHPSLDESFSMAALEAMALRKPVLAGVFTPGVREVLNYGEAGVLVNMRDPIELAAAMIQLGRSPEQRRRVGDAGYEHAASTYRLESTVSKYEALYRSMMQDSKLPTATEQLATEV
ncbi:glycosyltransferase family 4 protein [Terriglobus roseus]|uniref:Glycosyltransferase involved in cell wall bisynthesis n=1 Tax=Terriglobus roseus TaxID=392734 RepID=A0A1H4IZ69_9BACT|nr:glycosyltransferase family 4 protein [Terriglobus roseus]SEB39343.1 Glycosyltransferase involved in cell wall bisynthesis [Terriglobus roseus]